MPNFAEVELPCSSTQHIWIQADIKPNCLVCSPGKHLLVLTCIPNSPTRHRRPGARPLCCAALLSLKSFPLSGVAVNHRRCAHLLSSNRPPTVAAVTAPSWAERWAALSRFELRLCVAAIRLLRLRSQCGRASARAWSKLATMLNKLKPTSCNTYWSSNYTRKGACCSAVLFRICPCSFSNWSFFPSLPFSLIQFQLFHSSLSGFLEPAQASNTQKTKISISDREVLWGVRGGLGAVLPPPMNLQTLCGVRPGKT